MTGRTRVTLDIAPDGDAINGTVEDERGERRPFWGWLELVAALVRLRGGADGEEEADG